MSDDLDVSDDDVDRIADYVRLAVQLLGLGVCLFELWIVVVPEAVKIDLRAWWQTVTRPRAHNLTDIHRALIEMEVASEAEVTAALERLPRVA
jgi:hypothetical protein